MIWPKIARYAFWMSLHIAKHTTQRLQYFLEAHETAIVRSLHSSMMPQRLRRVEFGRVGRQGLDFQPLSVCLKPLLDFLLFVVGSVVVNVNYPAPRPIKTGSHLGIQEIHVGAPVENFIGIVNKSRIIHFHTAKNLGRLPRSGHWHQRLLAHPRPGAVKSRVLPETGFVLED